MVGSTQSVKALEDYIESHPDLQRSVRKTRLAVTHGFHSGFAEALLPELSKLARELNWKQPQIHLETCDEQSSRISFDHFLATHHTRQPVFFQHAVERLAKNYSSSFWLSAGQEPSIIRLVQKALSPRENHDFICPELTTPEAHVSLVHATIEMWKEGQVVQYWPFHRSTVVRVMSTNILPSRPTSFREVDTGFLSSAELQLRAQ